MDILFAILLAFVLAVVAYFGFAIKKISDNKKLFSSLNYVALRVRLPRINPKLQPELAQKPLPEQITPFEQFAVNLSALKIPLVLEVAVENFGEEITFYVAVPRRFVDVASKQILSFWPGSEIEPALDDYNIFNPSGVAAAAAVLQKEKWYLPIRTYATIGAADPFEAVLGAFSKLAKEGEGLAYQVIFRPTSRELVKQIQGGIKKLKEGKPLKEAFGGDVMKEIGSFMEAVSPKSEQQKAREKERTMETPKTIDDVAVKNLETKIQKPLFEVDMRLVASAQDRERASVILRNALAAFTQFANPPFNEFRGREFSGREMIEFISAFSYRLFDSGKKNILNAEELASIFHFPLPTTQVPNISWLGARSAPPPTNLPEAGIIVGESVWHGEKRPVRLTDDDRRRHFYVIGQTGSGKTTLLVEMIRQDLESGKGICFIDPHGDSADRVLGLVPKERVDDVVYFSPGDTSRPIGLNMLEYDPNFPEQKTFIINELIEIIDRLYNLRETGGPMFERYFRNALMLIMDDPAMGGTFLEFPRIFTNEDFRRDLLVKCKNPMVREFWLKEAERVTGEASLENMAPYIISKLDQFISNDFIKPIVAQRKSAINFRQIMDEGKILIVNLSKGRLGDLNSYLMGMVLVGKILMSSLSRVDVPEQSRRDFYLYIDEFQNFVTKSIGTILSEARKYRLSLIIAHQFIGQLPEDIRKAVFGNVGTIMSFRIGVEDAEVMEKQFSPVFAQTDLLNLQNFHAYLRLMIQGVVSQPFNVRILPPSQPQPDLIEKMKELSRLKYGRDRMEIEKEIEARYQEVL